MDGSVTEDGVGKEADDGRAMDASPTPVTPNARDQAAQALATAIASPSIPGLSAAIEKAKAAGVDSSAISTAEQKLGVLQAVARVTASLRQAISEADISKLAAALAQARSQKGVDPALVRNGTASQGLNHSEQVAEARDKATQALRTRSSGGRRGQNVALRNAREKGVNRIMIVEEKKYVRYWQSRNSMRQEQLML